MHLDDEPRQKHQLPQTRSSNSKFFGTFLMPGLDELRVLVSINDSSPTTHLSILHLSLQVATNGNTGLGPSWNPPQQS